MKKLITLFCFITSMQIVFAQTDSIDIQLQTILAEKNEELRMGKLFSYFELIQHTDPILTQTITKKLLTLSEINKDKLSETYAISMLSTVNMVLGNNTKGLEFALKALKMAEPLGNNTLLAIVYNRLGVAYGPVDTDRAKETLKQGLTFRNKTIPSTIFPIIAHNLGHRFTLENQLDSALEYLQLAEKLNL
jgi:tetratricopeptide (TPR) repeat protein